MSVIRKKPFIETLIGKLDSDQLTALKTAVNTDGITKKLSLVNTEQVPTVDDQGIYGCLYELELGRVKAGILINVDVGTEEAPEVLNTLICYHRFQDLAMFNIDLEHRTFERVNEFLDINELRRVLIDKSGSAIDVDSLHAVLSGSNLINADINEAGTKVDVHFDLTDAPARGHLEENNGVASWEDPELTLVPITLTNTSGSVYKSTSTIAGHSHVRLELEGEASHAGCGFDVFPYNSSECHVALRFLWGGSYVDASAYIDDEDYLCVDLGASITGVTNLICSVVEYYSKPIAVQAKKRARK